LKETIVTKLADLVERHEEIAALLSDPGVIADQSRFRELSREYARLEDVVRDYQSWCNARAELAAATEMASDQDPETWPRMSSTCSGNGWSGWNWR